MAVYKFAPCPYHNVRKDASMEERDYHLYNVSSCMDSIVDGEAYLCSLGCEGWLC